MIEEFSQRIQIIRQQIEVVYSYAALSPTQYQQKVAEAMEEILVSLGNLQLLQEEMQTNLEVMQVLQEELLQQNECLAGEYQYYYNLFQLAPDAYLVTDTQGMIVEANRAAAALFSVLPSSLIGKPLANFVLEAERSVFRTLLNQLSQINSVQEWDICMCPYRGEAFDASLLVKPVHDSSKSLVSLQIGIRNVTKYKQQKLQLPQSLASQHHLTTSVEKPRALDGLQVLFVDDEADARELISIVLEQHGVSVTAVASSAEALEVLERSRPDVLISDIRMPNEDGYALLQKVRDIELKKGWQIPTIALTAYLSEDRLKAISAGFQSHLHKLAEPKELVAMVAYLAKRTST